MNNVVQSKKSYMNSNNVQNVNTIQAPTFYNYNIRVKAKNDKILEQMLHRNKDEEEEEEEEEEEAPEAQDWESTEKFQNKIWENEIREISKFVQLKHGEVNRGIKDERWHSGKLMKIKKKAKHPKLVVERLRAFSRESNTLARSSKKKSPNFVDNDSDSDEEWDGNYVVEEPCKKKNFRRKDKVYEENFEVEEAYSEEELLRPPKMKSSIQEVYEKDDEEEKEGNFVVAEASSEEKLQWPRKKKSSRQEDKVYEKDDEEEREGNIIVEEASSKEELERPCEKKSSRQKDKFYKGNFVVEEASSEEERPVRMGGSSDGRDRLRPEEVESMCEQLLANIKA